MKDLLNKIHLADNMDIMAQLDDNSIDSIVTDPPYGLSFMGKKWDYAIPDVDTWEECLRVLKPGGHLLSFAGTRTQHRMACNIEDAGFEIRDMIAWVYGSGFPKSLNISKAIDKMQGNEREIVGEKPYTNDKSIQGNSYNKGNYEKIQEYITKPASSEAEQWDGWGSSIKPALEPITLARKPLGEKTIVDNVLKWGIGGLNIDGCRIETKEEIGRDNRNIKNSILSPKDGWNKNSMKGLNTTGQSQGRFPANFIHDGSEEVEELFPQSKSTGGKGVASRKTASGNNIYGKYKEGYKSANIGGLGDEGSASRFFYCAKASKAERGENNKHPTVKPLNLIKYLIKLVTPINGIVFDPFSGSGTLPIACIEDGFQYIACENDPDYHKASLERIQPYLDQGKLF